MGGKAKLLILIAFFSICTITLGVFLVSGGLEDDIHCGLYGDFCEGLLGSDDSDVNAAEPLGDRPLVQGTCIEDWEECVECFGGGALSGVEEGDYQPVGGRTVSFAAVSFADDDCTSDYCDFFSYAYTDYCFGNLLREYYLEYTDNPDPAENVSECVPKTYDCPSVYGASYICQSGICVACTNECESVGLRRCYGGGVQECRENWDGDPCLEWGIIQSCAGNEECRGVECLDPGTCTCEGCQMGGGCSTRVTSDNCNWDENYNAECDEDNCPGSFCIDQYDPMPCDCEKPDECTFKSDCVINSGPGYGGTLCYSCDNYDCWYADRGIECSVNLPPTVYGQCDGGDRCSCWEGMSCDGNEYCNICDNIYPGDHYCSSGKCCPVGSYWDDVNGVCKRVRHEECCDTSSWDGQTRCGGCCGAGLSENCSAYDESYPYYWHDQNEIWQCDYDQNQDSVYDFVYDCDQSDGCYASGNGCEDRDYGCSHNLNGIGYDAYCNPSISNQQTDYVEPPVNYCSGEEVTTHDWSHDYYCDDYGATFNGTCTDHGSWVNDQLVEDCDVSDGWNGGGNTAGCGDDPTSIYSDYSCSGGACTSSDTNTQDCDISDVCGNVCDGTVIKSYLDYYVITDTDECDFEWGSIVEDCAARLPTDSDGGDVPGTAGTCTNYTTGCSGGICPSSTYADVCDSGTQLTEYYSISNNLCPSKTYSCSDFEVAASGDILDNPATTGTCTGGTGAGCSSGRFSTTSGSSGAEGCVNPNDCPGGANCVFREYYAISSGDACLGSDTCTAKTYDPDTNSNTCSACIGSGKYDIGGISGCCGDDPSENILTSQCDEHACDTNSSDDACCDDADDCVLNDVCYNDGDDLPGQTGATCVNGVWEDITAPTTTIDLVGIPGWSNNWYSSDVQVTLTCSDTGGSNCDTTTYCVDTTDTCSPSTTYSTSFNITSEGTNYVRFYSTDIAGNQETPTQSTEIKIDKTNPSFVSYSISGCDYTDNPNQICWVQSGTQTTHTIQHSDSLSTPWRQYLTFTSGCNPNGCGCNWGELCSSGDEIKSSVSVDTGAIATHMWNDNYLNISAVSCVGVCTGTDIEEEWTVTAGTNEKNYAIYTFLYDEAGRGIGYTNTGWQLIIDNTDPDISIVINNDDVYANSTSVTLSLTYSDPGGSGVSDCRYRNEGEAWTPWEACTATRSWTLTTGDGVKTVYYEVRDLALNVKQENDFITLDTTLPSTSDALLGTLGWNGWFTTDVQVTLSCSDAAGSGCNTTFYCTDTTDTCSPSTSYSIPFNITSEGTNYVRFYSTDIAGNQETPTQSTEIKIDKTNPSFVSYSISGCDYTDNPNQICWVQTGTQTTHRIQHSDSTSTPYVQFLTFTSGCNPNGCGCNWDELCSSGDEIKSRVYVDTGSFSDIMWNDNYLNISAVSCVGVCTGTDIEEEWTVTAGTNEKNYAIYTFLYDEASRETGYIDTGWEFNSDNTPPDTEVADLPEYSMATIPLSWGGTDGGSGIECYRVEYTYEDGNGIPSPDGWTKPRNLEYCTGFTTYDFEIDYELDDVPDPEMLNNYTFYFRSMGKDLIDNWETPPAVPDANTTIFIPRLIEISAQSNETGRLIRDKGLFPRGKEITISAKAKEDVPENLDIQIYYSNHTRGATPSWTLYECNNTRSCNVTIGPFESGEVGYYVRAAVSGDPSNWERNPPVPGYWRFYIASHPLCNFLVTDVLTMILGSSGLVGIEVRNIQDQFDVIGLNFSNNFAKFVETDSQYIEVQLNPGEGVNVPKIIYARLVSSSDNFQLTLGGNSSIDSTMFDMDTIEVVIGYPADFPGLSTFGIIILALLATLIYLKLVRIEN